MQQGQHVLGLRGEATGNTMREKGMQDKGQKNSLGESCLLHAQALAVMQHFVSVWLLAI